MRADGAAEAGHSGGVSAQRPTLHTVTVESVVDAGARGALVLLPRVGVVMVGARRRQAPVCRTETAGHLIAEARASRVMESAQ